MKYNQPYGVSDPNAAYINGNPTTGTMGSIPPAAAMEFPQRELVALIAACGLTPSNADSAQLLKAIKFADVLNVFKQGTNGGTAAAWAMTCPTLPVMPPPVGTAVWFKPGVASVNGGTTFTLNGSAPKPVVCVDLSPIHIGDIVASAWLLLYFDGANWQVVAGSSRAPGMLPPLFATTNWYVNGTTGDDAAYDGSAATHTTANHGPFRTIQRAADETLKYNMNGYDQFVNVADYGGGYANFDCKQTNGSGTVWFIGNEANPQNVPVTAATPNTHAIHQLGGFYAFKGFRISATGRGNSSGLAISAGNGAYANLRFGPCPNGYHITANYSGQVQQLAGTITIEAGASAARHLSANTNSNIFVDLTLSALNILGAVNIGAFIEATSQSNSQMTYSSITGKANVHGLQYNAISNGVVYALGGGATYFPGDSTGATSFGGQYLP